MRAGKVAVAFGDIKTAWTFHDHGNSHAGPTPLELVWADEFDGPGIDATFWSFQLGNGSQYGVPGWGNNELQWYTSSPANAAVANGTLRLTALRNDSGREFTSARLRTAGLRDFVPAGPLQLLRFEARLQLPQGGDGIWPALWMLPTPAGQPMVAAWPGSAAAVPSGLAYGAWPASGEIDIVEAVNDAASVFGTAHFDAYQMQGGSMDANTSVGAFAGAWHVYALDWTLESLHWFIDGVPLAAAYPRCVAPGGWFSDARAAAGDCAAPFDQPFHLLVNLAVGGELPGKAPGPDTVFPQTLALDYVRVYKRAYIPGSSLSRRRRSGRRL
ncbi:hypothetical protein WJX81_005146 [Elliptochloris bilobata]|uniref:GH16 domain-containing protein n=1 Tax=Elliptochloris bilobata TaxID=381761 RepID=A0AAW1RJL9_9CHLO